MAKIRAKNVKPKVKGDFKKLRAKVGKKVVRSNLTKISVKTKQIQVPLQAKLTSLVDIEDQKKVLNDILRQINHYNDSSRVDALEMLKRFLSTCSNSESYIVVVISKVIELLFDNDKETRKSLLDLLSNLFAKFITVVFSPVSIILTTYICSGLTSLSKGIRKDAISLLSQISERHCSLLEASLEKIVQHLLSLLSDSFLVAAAVSLYATSSSSSSSTTASKTDHLSLRSSSSSILSPTTTSHLSGKSTSTAAPTSTSLVSILKVLETLLGKLLLLQVDPTSSLDAATSANSASTAHHHSGNILLRKVRSSPKSVLDLPQKYRSLFTSYGSHSSVLSSSTSSSFPPTVTATSPSNGYSPQAELSDNCILILFSRLLTLWNSLLSDPSCTHVTPSLLPLLLSLVSIAAHTVKALPQGTAHSDDIYTSIIRFVKCVLLSFPHTLDDSSIVSLRRDIVDRITLELEQLDFVICDLLLSVLTISNGYSNFSLSAASLSLRNPRKELEVELGTVQDFLLLSLSHRVDSMMATQQQQQQLGLVVGGGGGGENETITAGTKYLFRLLYHLLVASKMVVTETRAEGYTDVDVLHHHNGVASSLQSRVVDQLDRILSAATTTAAIASTGSSSSIRPSPSPLLRPALICLCSIISHNSNVFEVSHASSIGSGHTTLLTNNIFIKLIECLVKIPSLLKLWFRESPIVLETVAKALLSVVNRVALSDMEMCALLEKAVLSIFETNSNSSSGNTSRPNLYSGSPLTVRFLWLDIWAQTSFQDMASTTAQLLNCVVTTTGTGTAISAPAADSCTVGNRTVEFRYALRLVYQRRKEMASPGGFIDILANTLISYLKHQLSRSSIKLGEMTSTQIQSLLIRGESSERGEEGRSVSHLAGRCGWLASEVGEVARWSCSVASTGIFSVTLRLLQTITNAFSNSYSTDLSTSSSSSSTSKSKSMSIDWTKRYAIMVAAAATLAALLPPHRTEVGSDHSEVSVEPLPDLPLPAKELDGFLMSYCMQCFVDIFPSYSSSSSSKEELEERVRQSPQHLDPLYRIINTISSYRSNLASKYNVNSIWMDLLEVEEVDGIAKEVLWAVDGLLKPWQLLETAMKTKVLKIIELFINRNANDISTATDKLVINTSTVIRIVTDFLLLIAKHAALESDENIRAEAMRIHLLTMDCMIY